VPLSPCPYYLISRNKKFISIQFSFLLISIFAAYSSSSSWDEASLKVNLPDKGIPEVESPFLQRATHPVRAAYHRPDKRLYGLAILPGSGREERHRKSCRPLSRLPSEGVWNNHPCYVLVASKDLLQNHPDMAMAVSAILLSGGDYAQEHPNDLPEITANRLIWETEIICWAETKSALVLY
jgi:hypothetical protein